jgi:hypothetical protein
MTRRATARGGSFVMSHACILTAPYNLFVLSLAKHPYGYARLPARHNDLP